MISRTLFMSAALMAVLSVPSLGLSIQANHDDDMISAQTDLDLFAEPYAETDQPKPKPPALTPAQLKAAKKLGLEGTEQQVVTNPKLQKMLAETGTETDQPKPKPPALTPAQLKAAKKLGLEGTEQQVVTNPKLQKMLAETGTETEQLFTPAF